MIREIHYYFLQVETFCFRYCIFFLSNCSYFFLKKQLCKQQILILNEIVSENYEDD